jgi:hypothetical protein
MRLAASRAVAIESSRGWRISKERQSHKIDVIVALGMAAHACVTVYEAPAPHFGSWTTRPCANHLGYNAASDDRQARINAMSPQQAIAAGFLSRERAIREGWISE